MQNDKISGNGATETLTSTPPQPQYQWFLLSPQILTNGSDFTTNLYSQSVSPTPSSCSFDEETSNSATENRLYLARLTLQYQDLLDRYRICFSRLNETAQETEILRQENARLRIANRDLSKQLSVMSGSRNLVDDFRHLGIGDIGRNGRFSADISGVSPTSVLGSEESWFERRSEDRDLLPKSISVRSTGFLKVNQAGPYRASSNLASRIRVASPVREVSQGVDAPGGDKKDESGALEFEVYNQGMFKTELCNKWQESGTCPYGDECRFAHGIAELRPIIRHPRYKTEVCRMVLMGDTCPYGHRCHFRHALTEQDKFENSA